MQKKLKWTGVVVAFVFSGLQFTSPPRTNPEFDEGQTLQRTSIVPAEVFALFERSCNDCHSNNTNWRWYTYVAPVSWFTVGHVNDARAELNFSEWGTYSARKKETRLKAICDLSQRGEMPLASYVLVHPQVRLSSGEVKRICEWATDERSRLTVEDR